jgi:DNA-binding NarL/FixJ family response regulator
MKNEKIRVVIADDHTLMRDGIKQILSNYNFVDVVGECSDGEEAVAAYKKLKPDVLLLDINMPKMNGFTVFANLLAGGDVPKILFLTMHDNNEYIIKALKTGALGYVLKGADSDELVLAFKKVAKGEKYFGGVITKEILNSSNNENKAKSLDGLSTRESEIVEFIKDGFSNKEIASKLSLSTRTIESHKANIMRKLEVNNTAGLLKKIYKNGNF